MIFQGGREGGSGPPVPPSGAAHAFLLERFGSSRRAVRVDWYFFLPGFSSDKDICDITLYAMDAFHVEYLHVYNGTTGKSKFSCVAKVL